MFYNLDDAQGIWDVGNTGVSSSVPTTLAATTYVPVHSPTLNVEASTPVIEVDHLMDKVATLTMEELTLPLVSTKRDRDEEQQSP